MISILYLTIAALVSVTNTQQLQQLPYDQHYMNTQQQATQSQSPSFQQTPFQPFPQEYGSQTPQFKTLESSGYSHPQPGFIDQHAQPQQQQQHLSFGQSQQPGKYQPLQTQQQAVGIPITRAQMQSMNQQPFMFQQQENSPQFMNQRPEGFHGQPQMIPVGMSPHEFADRRGPPDNRMHGGNPFKRQKKQKQPFGGRIRGPPVKMMEMNRIPKPPKYPLYDMPSIGMATPPPAPLMHPMSHMASSNAYSTFVKSPRGGPLQQRRNYQQQNRRRYPPQPPIRPGKRQPIHVKQIPRNQRRPLPGKKNYQTQSGYEHPMASNLDPQVNSPPLGRPLSFDEYMERPSHSFTDDPWNFDPFAAQYNSGMNTYAMKYNYDPLGMNVVDGSQSHLDPNKLSYPGDYFSLQDTSAVIKSPKTSQLGGWDKPPETYRTAAPSLLPPAPIKQDTSKAVKSGHKHQQERFDQTRSESRPNSFNVFDTSSSDSNIVKSDSINPLSLFSDNGSDGTNSPIEFSIEPSGGNDQYQSQYNIGQEATGSQSWQNYNQQNPEPYQPTYENTQSHNSYSNREDSEYAQSQNHDTYASKDEYDSPLQYSRKEDYVHRERPLHNLSDSYSPVGEINTELVPPSDDSDSLYRRQGARTTRQEKLPLVEVEGLSLFKDVLKNVNASGARNQLYSALLI